MNIGLLKMSPLMIKGYVVVLGVGALSIGCWQLEKFLAKKGYTRTANITSKVYKALLIVVCVGSFIWFFENNHLTLFFKE